MSPSDRNLLALAESTPLPKLASWMGFSLPALERRLDRLRLAAQADALLKPPQALPERSAPQPTPERQPRPAPTPRVVPSGPPASSLPPGEHSAGVPTARERGGAAERGASAAHPLSAAVRPESRRREPDALRARPAKAPEARLPVRLVPPSRFGDRRAVEVLRPLTPARLRFARMFDAAGWSLAEVAWLFDADAEILAAELRPGAG